MKLGIHAYAYCSQWSNETLDLIDRAKNLGLDFIEIPLMVLEDFDVDAVSERLKVVGLDIVTSTVLSEDTDITSNNPEIRIKGVEYLKACAKATNDPGGTSFSGVIYSQHAKNTRDRPTEMTWKHSAECLKDVAQYAKSLGVTIALEPVNRYETYLVNTCEHALKLIGMVGEDNMRIHLDTYHMNIEEKSFYEATKLAGDKLVHYHLCENDRGIPGTGLVMIRLAIFPLVIDPKDFTSPIA